MAGDFQTPLTSIIRQATSKETGAVNGTPEAQRHVTTTSRSRKKSKTPSKNTSRQIKRETCPNLWHSQSCSKREAASETGLLQDTREISNQHGYLKKLKKETGQ